jgi:predicted DNA-binding transcriptional regulator YafY
VFVGGSASGAVIAGYAPPTRASMASISEAFFNLHCLEISYVDQKGVATTREIEPHFLYCNAPVWYLLAFDRLRRAVRFFRIDRITSARVLSSRFRPARPEPYLAAAERGVISA